MIVYGINPVLEAMRAGRVKQLWIAERRDDRMRDLLAFARTHGISAQRVAPDVLSRRARGGVHQGVVADVDDAADYSRCWRGFLRARWGRCDGDRKRGDPRDASIRDREHAVPDLE